MENTHVVKEISLTIEKRALVLLLPYLGSISLQARTKLKKSLTNILNCYPWSYWGECWRYLNAKTGEHGISPLIKKQAEPKNCPVGNHLQFGTHSTSYDILTRKIKMLLLELKRSLLWEINHLWRYNGFSLLSAKIFLIG